MPALSRTLSPFIPRADQGQPWLIEIVGPQYAGKTTIADLLALALDENATKYVRVENDVLIHGFFPGYVKLRSNNEREKAHTYMHARRPLLYDLSLRIIRSALRAGYTVIYDHLETHIYRHGRARQLCRQTKARYLSVLVTAPLERLRERWNPKDRDPRRVTELEETYRKLQTLARKVPFGMTIDTSVTSLDEAAKHLMSAMNPRLNPEVLERTTIPHPRRRPRGFANPKFARRGSWLGRPMDSAIETVGLTRVFRVRNDNGSFRRTAGRKGRMDSIVAVANVNLKIRTGEFFGLLGPNGAGKSALVRMLSTVLTPTRGTAYMNGYDVRHEDFEVRKQLGVVIASGWNVLYQRLCGWDNLDFYGALYGIPKARRMERAKFLLNYLGIGERAHDQVQKSSTGMQRRLVLCKALLPDSPVLLLDEPTVGLDVDTTRRFGELLKKINREQKKTILLTTHHMSEAERLCDRVAILKKGKIVACDTPDRLRGKTGEQSLENAYVTIVGNT